MQCLQCNKEIISNGTKPVKYCSDACRKRYKRTEQTDKPAATGQIIEQTDTNGQQPISLTMDNINELTNNSASYTPQGCTQSQETISDIPLNSGDILPLDLTIHDFNYDVNKYQSYVINRNKQTRDCIAATPLDVLKQSDQFIPAWRYAIG